MSTELEQATQLVNLKTGEQLSLDSPTEDLARYVDDMRVLKSEIQEVVNIVGRTLLTRLDFRGKSSLHAGAWKLSAPSPKPEEVWDGALLRAELMSFVDAGVLSIEAVDDAVEQIITFKVKKAGVNSLRNLGGEIAATVEGLKGSKEKTRYVKVERA